MMVQIRRKTTPIRFRNGRNGIRILMPRESGIVSTAAQSAELAVAFFPEKGEDENREDAGTDKTGEFLDELECLLQG